MKRWSKKNKGKLLREVGEVLGNEDEGSRANKKWDSMANEWRVSNVWEVVEVTKN